MFYTLPNTEHRAALNWHSNVSYVNKQFLRCYTLQTINTVTGRLNRYIGEKDMQTSYVIKTKRKRERESSWQDIWEHTWAYGDRQIGRQTETTIFPPIHWHSSHFTVIMVLWTLNSTECQKRAKQTVLTDSLWSSKPSKATKSLLSPRGRLDSAQTTNLPSQTRHLSKGSLLGDWLNKSTDESFSSSLIGICACVSLNTKLPLRLRKAPLVNHIIRLTKR